LVKLFIGLGVLIFVGSCVAVGLALPYVVLERGFTQVIAGTVGMNAGLMLIGIGVVLREIRKAPRQASAMVAPEAALPAESASGVGQGAVLAAGAAAASLAAAATAEAGSDKRDQFELDWPKPDAPAPVAEPVLDLPTFEVPPPGLSVASEGVEVRDGDQIEPTFSMERAHDMPGQDEFARLRAALSDQLERPDSTPEPADAPEVVQETLTPLAAHSEQADDGAIPAFAHEREASDFEELDREDMHGVDLDSAAVAGDAPAGSTADEGLASPDAADDELEDADGTVPADDPPDEAAQPEPAAEPEPAVVSNEGVVRAYQVGDTAFTVYGDGTIRAETSEGEFTFESMDEVRAFLMREKLKVRT
jgi:hypothetical protein